MNKQELSELLHSLDATVNEGISNSDRSKETRIVYWNTVEEDINASGEGYENLQTYQISIFSPKPNCSVYQELRKKLREKGIHPVFYHEYVENDPVFQKNWHTYFSMEVVENGTGTI